MRFVIVMILALLISCGGQSNEQSAEEKIDLSGRRVDILGSIPADRLDVWKKLQADCQKQTGVALILHQAEEPMQVLEGQLADDILPDLLLLRIPDDLDYLDEFLRSDLVIPLQEWLGEQWLEDRYSFQLRQALSVEGVMVAAWLWPRVNAVGWYRPARFEEEGFWVPASSAELFDLQAAIVNDVRGMSFAAPDLSTFLSEPDSGWVYIQDVYADGLAAGNETEMEDEMEDEQAGEENNPLDEIALFPMPPQDAFDIGVHGLAIAAMTDRPEVRAVVKWLIAPERGAEWETVQTAGKMDEFVRQRHAEFLQTLDFRDK
ncbi:MAG: hypothetical protein D6B26_03870 [Spirochaetaceae bacterium]|nr:MAG: hypothetical protein D6B26_03870 [Spirochaetaceae bacterium]